jgi:hypothetical protein
MTKQIVVEAIQNVRSLGNLPSNRVTGGSQGNLPEKKFRAGAVSATVWVNKGENGDYRTIAIERSYTDKEGKWQSTNSLRINDLPKAEVVLHKAYEFLVFKEQELFAGSA